MWLLVALSSNWVPALEKTGLSSRGDFWAVVMNPSPTSSSLGTPRRLGVMQSVVLQLRLAGVNEHPTH